VLTMDIHSSYGSNGTVFIILPVFRNPVYQIGIEYSINQSINIRLLRACQNACVLFNLWLH